MQQALDVPFVFASNCYGFLFYDRTGTQLETELSLDQFPGPQESSGNAIANGRAWTTPPAPRLKRRVSATDQHHRD